MKKLIITSFSIIASLTLLAGDIVIYPNGIATNNLIHGTTCPGDNRWHATYAKTVASGYGWAPDTNGNTVFTATITNRTDIHVQASGRGGDLDCNQISVQVPNVPPSDKYRFNAWGTNNPPTTTNDLPLVLHNFNP